MEAAKDEFYPTERQALTESAEDDIRLSDRGTTIRPEEVDSITLQVGQEFRFENDWLNFGTVTKIEYV